MKVTFLGTLPPIIGLSPYCLHLSNELSKLIDLKFIDFKAFSKKAESFSGTTKINKDFYYQILKKINIEKLLSWNNPISGLKAGINLKSDILHVQWWIYSLFPVYFPLILLSKIKGIKIVFSIHNILPHEKNNKDLLIDFLLNKIIFFFVDEFIVHNKRNKDNFIKLYKINEEKITIITHGSLELIKRKDISKTEARKYLNMPIGKKIILFFGYIRPYKGVDVLLKAFSKINKYNNDFFLVIAGQLWNDSWDKYHKIITENNLSKKIKVDLGFVPENKVQYYLSAADIVVLPYKHLDTHGGVGALAIAFNKAIIATDVGGSSDYVLDKTALAKANDVNDLANKLSAVLSNEKFHSKLSADSKKIAQKNTWDIIAKKTVEVYKKTLSS